MKCASHMMGKFHFISEGYFMSAGHFILRKQYFIQEEHKINNAPFALAKGAFRIYGLNFDSIMTCSPVSGCVNSILLAHRRWYA